MTSRNPARPAARPAARSAALVAMAVAVLAGIAGCRSPVTSSPPSTPESRVATGHRELQRGPDTAPADTPPGDPEGALGEADGAVPDGASIFDDGLPAVANLDSGLRRAARRAARAADDDGVTFVVTSGWRSPEYQDQLLREAVAKYGSEAEAARWVATADTSSHVSGDAIDIGHTAATTWLSEHGSGYGLCRIYRNEPWHFELRPDAVDDGCPTPYADPTQDPRMQG